MSETAVESTSADVEGTRAFTSSVHDDDDGALRTGAGFREALRAYASEDPAYNGVATMGGPLWDADADAGADAGWDGSWTRTPSTGGQNRNGKEKSGKCPPDGGNAPPPDENLREENETASGGNAEGVRGR
ncbi:hypothetical protein DFH09DRAFT_1101322 [Mycena vulgaris]|nr:hypothetical protein DFH09DRAFT_1101322 [Mycena vulgaris]